MPDFHITPLIHPLILRAGNPHKAPAQQVYLTRLVEAEKNDRAPKTWNTQEAPPGSYLYPSLQQLDEWWRDFQSGGYNAICHDLETAGQFIICDGLTPLNTITGDIGRNLCLRFRGRGGVRWWSTFAEHCIAVDWFGNILAQSNVGFVGHNIVGFDIPILKRHGFTIAGPIIDTMVLMSRAYPEFSKGLQYCATLFLYAPAWKRMIKTQDDGAEKT